MNASDDLRRNEHWLAAQGNAFQAAMNGEPLESSLGILIRTILEQSAGDPRCAFYIGDGNGGPHHVIGLAEGPMTSLAGFQVPPDHRGCWSFPLETATGTLVGSFAMYFREPRDPSPRDRELAAKLTQTAAILVSHSRESAERARAEAALRTSNQRFRQFATASSGALWIRDAATLRMEYTSPAIAEIYGAPPDELLGDVRHWAAAIVPEDRDRALAHLARAQAGESVVHEFRIQRPSDRAFRWIRDTDFPLFDEQGRVQRIGGITEDVTEAKLAVEHQGVLLAELQHRVRNIMAIIRSIASRTGERAESVGEYAELMSGRLLALARVQALLTRSASVRAGIHEIVRDELGAQTPHDNPCVLDGPDVKLSPKAAEVLTLVVHELATNALKYGALSVPQGRVTVRWRQLDRCGTPWLGFDWLESGAPVGARPWIPGQHRRRGFGSELIEGRVPYELRGTGSIDIGPGGAHCHLEFPLDEGASVLETSAPDQATVFGGALDMTGQPHLNGHRVLVVEDEYFIATDAARALVGAGAEVMGPCPDEDAANVQLRRLRPDAVVVDINLGAGPAFEFAGSLRERGIPFLFITGYDAEIIPPEFDDVERLQKPVELRQMIQAVSRLLPAA